MRFLFRILVLFTVTCYADESTANLLSNLVNINDQADPSLNQPIVSTNNPADSSAVYDSYVNTDSPAALTGLQPSLESPVNANGQLGSAAPYDLALVPTIPEASAGIGDPTLGNARITDDHSSNPTALSKPIPSNDLAFDHRQHNADPPIDCELPREVACCTMYGKMRMCVKLVYRLSKQCKYATLACCLYIDKQFQCIDEKVLVQDDEGVDSVEQVGSGVQGHEGMTEEEIEKLSRAREAAEQRRREAAERKAREDELWSQQDFYREEGKKVREDAKKGSNWKIQWPDIQLGLPGFVNEWIQNISH